VSNASLTDRVRSGDPRAIARAISLIEDEAPQGAELVRRLFAHTGRAYLVGVTGPPGAGKSTLVDRMISGFRKAGSTVGVVAVDPTSPFSGGAILGDRVRMQAQASDPGVFIRSMATRGHLGGLARATSEVALVFDAAGKDVVLIETVGVGQDEVDIVRTADVSIVTIVPGAGDEVQALKAGIMEIADIFVVNKADREGADRTMASIEALQSLRPSGRGSGGRRSSRRRRRRGAGWRNCSRRSTASRRIRPRRAATAAARAPSGACASCSGSASCSTSSVTCWRPASSTGRWSRSPRASWIRIRRSTGSWPAP
jgi:LAO/AO transport system kinase